MDFDYTLGTSIHNRENKNKILMNRSMENNTKTNQSHMEIIYRRTLTFVVAGTSIQKRENKNKILISRSMETEHYKKPSITSGNNLQKEEPLPLLGKQAPASKRGALRGEKESMYTHASSL